MIRRLPPVLAAMIIACTALAFAATGLSHRAPTPQDITAEVMALLSPADFCGTAHSGGAPDSCPLCHLPGAVPVPQAATPARPLLAALAGPVVPGRENPHPHRVRDPGRGMRAPPAFV